jgi:hypothetical protein
VTLTDQLTARQDHRADDKKNSSPRKWPRRSSTKPSPS